MRTLPLLLAVAFVGCGDDTPDAPAGPPPPPVTVTGELAEGDEKMLDGSYGDAYTLVVREGQSIEASFETRDFDPYMFLKTPSGKDNFETDNGGFGDLQNARTFLQVDEPGEWTIYVSSLERGQTGQYTLTYGIFDPDYPDTTDVEMMEMMEEIGAEFEAAE